MAKRQITFFELMCLDFSFKYLSIENDFIVDKKNNSRLSLDRFIGLIEKNPCSIVDFIDSNALVIFDELEECRKFTKNWFF